MSINDSIRTAGAVAANIEYAERTADDSKLGTYCYLFDTLFPKGKWPRLEPGQEQDVISRFESKLSTMTTPGSGWELDPHSPQNIGMRLAAYYARKGLAVERARVIRLVAEAFERRAKLGDALSGLVFLEDAREHFMMAGLREEAERIQLDAQNLGPEAEKRLVRSSVSHEIPSEVLEGFLNEMTAGGVESSLRRLALHHLPDQTEIAQSASEIARKHPLYGLLAARPLKIGHGHIEADVSDETGDPDGVMIHETERALQLQAPWIGLILERLVRDGLIAEDVVGFVLKCPLFASDRHALIRRGVSAHFIGDYVQAIHTLVPQIERAIVNLAPLGGKPSNKGHRTGRGLMQFKNLNDLLEKEAWPVTEVGGENLRMYLLSALAHPKGLNIRNDVCHGLWSADRFTLPVSERVLHVLLAVALLTVKEVGDEDSSSATTDEGPAGGESKVES